MSPEKNQEDENEITKTIKEIEEEIEGERWLPDVNDENVTSLPLELLLEVMREGDLKANMQRIYNAYKSFKETIRKDYPWLGKDDPSVTGSINYIVMNYALAIVEAILPFADKCYMPKRADRHRLLYLLDQIRDWITPSDEKEKKEE